MAELDEEQASFLVETTREVMRSGEVETPTVTPIARLLVLTGFYRARI